MPELYLVLKIAALDHINAFSNVGVKITTNFIANRWLHLVSMKGSKALINVLTMNCRINQRRANRAPLVSALKV